MFVLWLCNDHVSSVPTPAPSNRRSPACKLHRCNSKQSLAQEREVHRLQESGDGLAFGGGSEHSPINYTAKQGRGVSETRQGGIR